MRDSHSESRQVLVDSALEGLNETFGFSEEPRCTGFSFGGLGILAQHTSYFNGFAVILKVSRGIAVAVRLTRFDVLRVSFQARRKESEIGAEGEALWQGVIGNLVRRLLPGVEGIEMVVMSNMPPRCLEANLASLAAATMSALEKLPGFCLPADPLAISLEAIEEAIGAEFSKAFLLAARHDTPDTFVVIDTETRETIPLEGPPREQLCWGIFDAGQGSPRDVSFYSQCGRMAEEALELLQGGRFQHISSFRDIEHQQLDRILNTLPRRLRPIVRHLVKEDKRVHGLIGAIRRKDWQMLGGLLLMSHASVQSDWKGSDEQVDFVVEEISKSGSEGMYGACVTGRSRCVLVAGQPLVFARTMASVAEGFTKQFDVAPRLWFV